MKRTPRFEDGIGVHRKLRRVRLSRIQPCWMSSDSDFEPVSGLACLWFCGGRLRHVAIVVVCLADLTVKCTDHVIFRPTLSVILCRSMS